MDIFEEGGDGRARVSTDAIKRADEAGVSVKTARGDLMSIILVPEESIDIDATAASAAGAAATAAAGSITVGECAITMTRSVGDFYAHRYGVTAVPEVRRLRLSDLAPAGSASRCCSRATASGTSTVSTR